MRVDRVHPNTVPHVWQLVKPLIDKALKYSNGEHLGSDLLQPLLEGNYCLLLGIDDNECIISAIVCKINIYAQKKSLFVITWAVDTGHGYDEWSDLFENKLIEIGHESGCSYLETWCRKGLAKKMSKYHGWTDKYAVATKKIL
tara:strand:- start:47 stop:475 length:429 start_codon:yes stop_codon:yes gene_type:complete